MQQWLCLVGNQVDLWETKGLTAIFDAKRSGRPPILTDEELQRLSELVQDEPRQLKKAVHPENAYFVS